MRAVIATNLYLYTVYNNVYTQLRQFVCPLSPPAPEPPGARGRLIRSKASYPRGAYVCIVGSRRRQVVVFLHRRRQPDLSTANSFVARKKKSARRKIKNDDKLTVVGTAETETERDRHVSRHLPASVVDSGKKLNVIYLYDDFSRL